MHADRQRRGHVQGGHSGDDGAAVPRLVAPSKKVTLPAGPEDGKRTAVSVTVSPKTGGVLDGVSVAADAPFSITRVTSFCVRFTGVRLVQ